MRRRTRARPTVPRGPSLKAQRREGREVEAGLAAEDLVGDDARRDAAEREAEVLVAEGEEEVAGFGRAAKHRQVIGERRAISHPRRESLGRKGGHERGEMALEHREAVRVR